MLKDPSKIEFKISHVFVKRIIVGIGYMGLDNKINFK